MTLLTVKRSLLPNGETLALKVSETITLYSSAGLETGDLAIGFILYRGQQIVGTYWDIAIGLEDFQDAERIAWSIRRLEKKLETERATKLVARNKRTLP